MHTDSNASHYALLYTRAELQQLRALACQELHQVCTGQHCPGTLCGPEVPADEQELAALTSLLDRIKLYTAALLVQTRALHTA